MHPVDEYAQLKQQITRLQARADALRDGFLQPHARLRSNQAEITVRMQLRKLFLKDRLPVEILHNPAYWQERISAVVTLQLFENGADDLKLTEPFGSLPSPRLATPHTGAAARGSS